MFGQDALSSVNNVKDDACSKASDLATDAVKTPNRVADAAGQATGATQDKADGLVSQADSLTDTPMTKPDEAEKKAESTLADAENAMNSYIAEANNEVAGAFALAADLFGNMPADNPKLPYEVSDHLKLGGLTDLKNSASGLLGNSPSATGNLMNTDKRYLADSKDLAKDAAAKIKEPVDVVKQRLAGYAQVAKESTDSAKNQVDGVSTSAQNAMGSRA